mgnify:CR=1 FL=1
MRLAFFWMRLFFRLPYLLYAAKKAKKMEFEQRYAYARKVMGPIVRKLHCPLEVIGEENIPEEKGMLFVGNHQGSADAFIYMQANAHPTTSVSKKEGAKIPVLSDWYDALEVIYFDRDNLRDAARMVKEVTETLKGGRNVTIFPEGTRSKSQTVQTFRPGALKPAYRAKAVIQPFALVNAYIPLDSREPHKTIRVVFLKPWFYADYAAYTTVELAELLKAQIENAIRENA